MRVEVAHNVDPEPEEDLPLFEVWLEGYRWRGTGPLKTRGTGGATGTCDGGED